MPTTIKRLGRVSPTPAMSEPVTPEQAASGQVEPAIVKRVKNTAVAAGRSRLLHVNLPTDLVNAIRLMAEQTDRSITTQVRRLLENSPELIEFIEDNELS